MNLKEFKAIISAKSNQSLEDLMLAARRETLKHFGRTIQLYSPLYLSNECVNSCTYCGFNRRSKIKRITLDIKQVEKEAQFLRKQGFQHILLLTGEDSSRVPVDYLENAIRTAKDLFVSVSIEVYPLREEDYSRLIAAGVDGLTIYQETYHLPTYHRVHPDGPKRDFKWRLGAPERAARAGMRKIGIGFLLGLYDWRDEALKLAEHLQSLLKNFWQAQFQISFPRINLPAGRQAPIEADFKVGYPVSDQEFIRLLCAFRLLFPQIGFTLSTRERAKLRDKIFPFGFTQMSAGSKTFPGAYSVGIKSGKQFEIADDRTPRQVVKALVKSGYEPVWKDWERSFA
jgi:2-iminoacetate synthase